MALAKILPLKEEEPTAMTDVCNGCEVSHTDFVIGYNNSEDALISFYVQHGLITRSRTCEGCGQSIPLRKLRGHFVFQCGRRVGGERCNWSASAFKNTFFSKAKIPIFQIGQFIILWCNVPKPRLPYIQLELRISKNCVSDWSSYCRDVCEHWVITHGHKIGGQGVVVEVAENQLQGQGVYGGVERGNIRNFFVVPIEMRDKDCLLAVIRDWVLPGTTIISNLWKSYDCLKDEGFVDLKVNNSLQFVDDVRIGPVKRANRAEEPVSGPSAHTQTLKNRWSVLKNASCGVPGSKRGSLQGYLAEFLFKSNFPINERVHHFLLAAAELHTPLQ